MAAIINEHNRQEVTEHTDRICPYCDKPVGGNHVAYGNDALHVSCYEAFCEEMNALYDRHLKPIDPEVFADVLDPDWCQPEDETLDLFFIERDDNNV